MRKSGKACIKIGRKRAKRGKEKKRKKRKSINPKRAGIPSFGYVLNTSSIYLYKKQKPCCRQSF
jgi:hypothetical protein